MVPKFKHLVMTFESDLPIIWIDDTRRSKSVVERPSPIELSRDVVTIGVIALRHFLKTCLVAFI